MERLYKYMNEETDCVNLYESTILSIENDLNNKEILFIIDWTEGNPYVLLKCKTYSNVEINILHNEKYGKDWIGTFEITGFSYIKREDNYTVQFNFEHTLTGYIRIECKSFVCFTPSEPLSCGGNDNLINDYE